MTDVDRDEYFLQVLDRLSENRSLPKHLPKALPEKGRHPDTHNGGNTLDSGIHHSYGRRGIKVPRSEIHERTQQQPNSSALNSPAYPQRKNEDKSRSPNFEDTADFRSSQHSRTSESSDSRYHKMVYETHHVTCSPRPEKSPMHLHRESRGADSPRLTRDRDVNRDHINDQVDENTTTVWKLEASRRQFQDSERTVQRMKYELERAARDLDESRARHTKNVEIMQELMHKSDMQEEKVGKLETELWALSRDSSSAKSSLVRQHCHLF
eukprot:Lankesteria_metandrocarpae@DN5147_c0_g1_i1.p1